jgi:hypothetical protein
MWITKLQSMEEILLSDQNKEMENMDKFEVQFIKLRDLQQNVKSLIQVRREKIDAGVHLDKENIIIKNKLVKFFDELLDDWHILDKIYKTQVKEEPKVDGEIDSKQQEKLNGKKDRLAKMLEGNQ